MTAVLHAAEIPVRVLARHRCAEAPDPRGAAVTVRRRVWTVPEAVPDTEDAAEHARGLAPPVLVYELLTSGEPRQREHAQRFKTRNDRLWRLARS